jgi:hypothetical protein
VSGDIVQRLARSLERGERVAVAEIVSGVGAGRRLLVWSAGHTYGDLGWPRLNQRVALYAEQLFARGAAAPEESVKRFAVPGEGEVDVRLTLAALA